MGVILSLRDDALARDLAKKRVPAEDLHRVDLTTRLRAEARITAGLAHPGVIPVHDIGTDEDGAFYFTMKLVSGHTFEEIVAAIHRGDPMWTRTRGLQTLLRVCETMAFAHSRGIIHRDLKPENVMVGDYGEVYVLDWGLAKPVGGTAVEPPGDRADAACEQALRTTMVGTVLGTPMYMPPEQASGDIGYTDARSDVYAIGALLYHLVAGVGPYVEAEEAGGRTAIIEALLTGPPVPLANRDRTASAELCAITAKAMARDPARRYAGAADLRTDLQAYLDGRVVAAHRTGAAAELRKWVTRNGALACALGVLFVLVVGGSLIFAVQTRRAANMIAAEQEREEAARRRAEGLRIVALAASKVDANPGLALALAVDGGTRAPGAYANTTLYAALLALRERATWRGHHGYVRDVRFSPDGRTVLSVGERPSLVLWDVGRGEPAVRLALPPGGISCARFSPDGAWIATAGYDGMLRWLDAATGAQVGSLPCGTGRVRDVAWSPDGTQLVAACPDGRIRIVTVRGDPAGRAIKAHAGPALAAAFDPTGARLVTLGADDTLKILDARTGRTLRSLPSPIEIQGPAPGPLRARVAWLEGGTQILAWHGHAAARVWDAASGEILAAFGGDATICFEPACSPDGRRVAIPLHRLAGDGAGYEIVLWDTLARREVWRAAGTGPWQGAAFSPNGHWLALSSRRVAEHPAALMDATSGRLQGRFLGHTYFVHAAAARDDGLVATASADGSVRLWRANAPGSTASPPGYALLARTPDGSRGVFANSAQTEPAALEVIDLPAGRTRRTLPPLDTRPERLALTPDGALVIGWDAAARRVRALRVRDAAEAWSRPPPVAVTNPLLLPRITLSPDGSRVVVSDVGVFEIVDVVTGGRVCRVDVPSGALSKLSWQPNGTGVFGALGKTHTAALWDARTGALRQTYAHGHKGWVTFAAMSPDQRTVATVASDRTLVLWDPDTATPIHRFDGLPRGDLEVAFAPDGRHLLVTSDTARLTVFDARERRLMATLPLAGLRLPDLGADGRGFSWTDGRVQRDLPFNVLAAARALRPRVLQPSEGAALDIPPSAESTSTVVARSHDAAFVASLAIAAIAEGRAPEADACERRLKTLAPDAPEQHAVDAARLLDAGDVSAAFAALGHAADGGAAPMVITHAAVFRRLHADARWGPLVERLHAADRIWH